MPRDLPRVDKDLLILVAAWAGNIDRYTRLRRPLMISGEVQCLVRGIYHDTFFAKWSSEQPRQANDPALHFTALELHRRCNTRCLMNNNMSWATDALPDEELPQSFWYPGRVAVNTLREQAHHCAANCAGLHCLRLQELVRRLGPRARSGTPVAGPT